MAEAWPAIPAPTNDLEIQNQSMVEHSDVEKIGISASRRRAARGVVVLGVAFVFSTSEKAVFESFYSATLNNGNKYLSASWLDDAGYPDTVAKIIEPAESKMIAAGIWSLAFKIQLKYIGKSVNGYLHPLYKEAI